MCYLNCWAQRRTGNNPTKLSLAKILIFGLKKVKKLEVFKSINSYECSPLSTDTFTDQKPPKKLRWTFCVFFLRHLEGSCCLALWSDPSYGESTITVRCFEKFVGTFFKIFLFLKKKYQYILWNFQFFKKVARKIVSKYLEIINFLKHFSEQFSNVCISVTFPGTVFNIFSFS